MFGGHPSQFLADDRNLETFGRADFYRAVHPRQSDSAGRPYNADAEFAGADTFQWLAEDSLQQTATTAANVNLTVGGSAPTVAAFNKAVIAGTSLEFPLRISDRVRRPQQRHQSGDHQDQVPPTQGTLTLNGTPVTLNQEIITATAITDSSGRRTTWSIRPPADRRRRQHRLDGLRRPALCRGRQHGPTDRGGKHGVDRFRQRQCHCQRGYQAQPERFYRFWPAGPAGQQRSYGRHADVHDHQQYGKQRKSDRRAHLAAISGTNATDFAVSTAPALTTLAAGQSTTFTITFTPHAAGIRTATVSIARFRGGRVYISLAGTGVTTALSTNTNAPACRSVCCRPAAARPRSRVTCWPWNIPDIFSMGAG